MPNYHAKIEPLSGIMRIYTERRDDSVHNSGIPFLISVTVRWVDYKTIEIMGLYQEEEKASIMLPSIWRKIRKSILTEAVKWNAEKVIFKRYKNGKELLKIISLEKFKKRLD